MNWQKSGYSPGELSRMQQEAIQRAREMQRRAQAATQQFNREFSPDGTGDLRNRPQGQAQNRSRPSQSQTSRSSSQQPKPEEHTSPPPPAPQKAQPQEPHPAKPPQESAPPQPMGANLLSPIHQVMDALHLDHEKIVLIGLMLILLNEGGDKKLLLALAYLLLF